MAREHYDIKGVRFSLDQGEVRRSPACRRARFRITGQYVAMAAAERLADLIDRGLGPAAGRVRGSLKVLGVRVRWEWLREGR